MLRGGAELIHFQSQRSCTCFHPRDGSFSAKYFWTCAVCGNHWLLMVVVAGAAIFRLVDDRRGVMTPRFICLPVLVNHTHLTSYTRIVSLHRVGSRSTD